MDPQNYKEADTMVWVDGNTRHEKEPGKGKVDYEISGFLQKRFILFIDNKWKGGIQVKGAEEQ